MSNENVKVGDVGVIDLGRGKYNIQVVAIAHGDVVYEYLDEGVREYLSAERAGYYYPSIVFSEGKKYDGMTIASWHQWFTPKQPEAKTRGNPHGNGCQCIHCREYNQWAEPNLSDGRFICYGCKSTHAYLYQ